MSNYQNHLIDPSYFYDAIEEFAFDYDIYIVDDKDIDDYGRTCRTYTLNHIRGSLQSQGKSLRQDLSGNTETLSYSFYCKSLYRIDIGDVIYYKGHYLRVVSVNDYDEWGVRSVTLNMIQLSTDRDLAAYVKYLSGVEIV